MHIRRHGLDYELHRAGASRLRLHSNTAALARFKLPFIYFRDKNSFLAGFLISILRVLVS